MGRVILAPIGDIVERHLPHVSAGFPKGRFTTDHFTSLVNDIEADFQRKEKFGASFDLSAAYDTVWHPDLFLKLLRIIPDGKLVRSMLLLIKNRYFYLETSNGKSSRTRNFRNGMAQGSQPWKVQPRDSTSALR